MVTLALYYWLAWIENVIFIAGFPRHLGEMQLKDFFSKFGQIEKFTYGYQGTFAIIQFCNRFVLTSSLHWLLFLWSNFVCVFFYCCYLPCFVLFQSRCPILLIKQIVLLWMSSDNKSAENIQHSE